MIDTDIISYYLKGDPSVFKSFERYLKQFDHIEISLIAYYEFLSGLMAKKASKQLEVFEAFISENIILGLSERSVQISADIYSKLRQTGKPVDDIDLLIAGVAMENDLVSVTNNVSHFGRISGLRIDNWKR
jgi:tRNA(fMet)-specific endonuclease VapC